MRAFVVVLDSVGIGAAPDAAAYGDVGSNTLAHTAMAANGLSMPCLHSLGLGNIPFEIPDGIHIKGVASTPTPLASVGAMREVSVGKDTTTGHWEMAGIELKKGLIVFPGEHPSFPRQLVRKFEKETGRKIIGNRAASGTAIIDELGERQMKTGEWIAYTSADSVFQLAAHEEVIPLAELYRACSVARKLCNQHQVGRVIARPYLGEPGNFTRTENRRDFSLRLPEPSILNHVSDAGIEVITVGKLDDIFPHSGITQSYHVENNRAAEDAVVEIAASFTKPAFVFANLIDFDMLYGHRRDARGYAKALESTDLFFACLLPLLTKDDLLIITADHGNDPTFAGTDHTREYVPLISYRFEHPAHPLGIRQGFFDIAQSLATFFGLRPMPRGVSFI